MSKNLQVRNLDDDLVLRLKRRAARNGRSTEAEHRGNSSPGTFGRSGALVW